MKITFLGTGTSQGIPMIGSTHPVCLSKDKRDKRLRVSILIEWEEFTYVIDCGPDFRYQMLRANVQKLNGILFTHEHSDHVAGLDDIRPFSFQLGAVPIFAQKRVLQNLKYRFDYIFNNVNKYPGAPSVEQHEIEEEDFMLHNLNVTPIKVMHGTLQILGYKFNNVAYLTDVKTISSEEKEKLQNLDIIIINAIRFKAHHSHLNLEEALVLINELKPKKTYLTHISHHLGFHAEVEKSLPENVFVAYDELVLEV
ncbi:phosphoribosyl 1,2-cyclic phosphate phosphodiesterase [Lutibacter agarilyticus]|uniref:Phosphoribosyl 1,2-cyclic phosphate phosphodiesterase n=1 Tax=Lutibacter agarilyticus TaxID=1109740 RepID=A0A238VD98_9FLAO|nr:MBL fold metallo-hydrolase [Lutibacter agarilyticus]SNR32134.1 phosphoribosyl 1,2-cyclic phosphate phosphodiesterase [Lutibacter agarilyticus]